MRLFYQVLCCLASMLFLSTGFANQQYFAHNNDVVQVSISQTELNRISVAEDRIQRVKALQGIFQIDKDEVTGDIFIKIISNEPKKTQTLYIRTEKGNTYSIEITPQKITAQTVLIKAIEKEKVSRAKQWEMASPYEETLVKLIKAMMLGQAPKGFSLESVHGDVYHDAQHLTYRLVAQFKGGALLGEVYEVCNTRAKKLVLDEKRIFPTGSLAVAVDNSILFYNQKTYVYRVISNG